MAPSLPNQHTCPRVLFASNGHGEDMIACRIIDHLRQFRPDLDIDAWPMVGAGTAYRRHGLRIVECANTLPSEGFATLDPGLMIRDLRQGWVGTHLRHLRTARSFGERYGLVVGVGDIIPLIVGAVTKGRFAFVGCAKSAYYTPGRAYNIAERTLMRRVCDAVFPRDSLTARTLTAQGVSCHACGNPMMDGLDGAPFPLPPDATGIALLPGSRRDTVENVLTLLTAAGATARRRARSGGAAGERLCFLIALPSGTDEAALAQALAERAPAEWRPADHGTRDARRLDGPDGSVAVLSEGRFADMLHAACLAIGMAGTANEQAVGLGVPLIAAPGTGVQGKRYVSMKMKLFGPSAVAALNGPDDMAAKASALLADPDRRRIMAAAGRERMGGPGASAAIARHLADLTG